MTTGIRLLFIALGFLLLPTIANFGWVVWKKNDALDWSPIEAKVLTIHRTKNSGTSKAGWSVQARVIAEKSQPEKEIEIVDSLSSDMRIQLTREMANATRIKIWENRRTGMRSVFAPVVPGLFEDFPLFLFFLGLPGAVAALFIVGERGTKKP
jgi:hypothetical protein